MKLASYFLRDVASYGLIVSDGVIDVGQPFREKYPTLKHALDQPEEIAALTSHRSADVSLQEIEFLPPIPDPGRIICIGQNYKSDMVKQGKEFPQYPILFTRFRDSQVGHAQPIIRPLVSKKYDFEGEMAFVIGKSGRHIKVDDALNFVSGYSCYNDGSVRDYQRHTSQDTPGKNFWHSGSFGPWLTTADEIPVPEDMVVTTHVNDVLLQRGEISDLLFGVADIITYLSSIFPLQPGDIVATGTAASPFGCGALQEPPVWLQPGDTVKVTIEQVGTLLNTVEDERNGVLK